MSELSKSKEYLSFRANIPRRTICVDSDGRKEWILYDVGPKSISSALICFPPVSGRADIYFQQMLGLSAAGYRVISSRIGDEHAGLIISSNSKIFLHPGDQSNLVVYLYIYVGEIMDSIIFVASSMEYPTYWTVSEFCEGFQKLLNHLHLGRVHLFGSSVGGFLAQKFAEFSIKSDRVKSLILCNTFVSTDIFEQTMAAPTFWMLPAVILKTMLMGNLDKGNIDAEIMDSINFVACSLDSLNQKDLASRLTLNCRKCRVDTEKLVNLPITIVDVNDECAISECVKEDLYKCYPNARRAHLKAGGNFPYLSRAAEINVYLQIHLREFNDTPYSAMEPEMEETDVDAVPLSSSSPRDNDH